MEQLISLDQMLENIKSKSEESRLTIEATQKSIEIINKIVKARENLGITQRELAKKCGIQQPALARIETFKVIPKINTLIKIAQAVGINIAAFTSMEKQQMQIWFSIGQVILSTSCYNNRIGDIYGNKNR